mgnify:CR=1 FL=1
MSGLLMKDMELLKVNIKTYFIVFAVGIIYLFVQTDGSIFFISYMIFVRLIYQNRIDIYQRMKHMESTSTFCVMQVIL